LLDFEENSSGRLEYCCHLNSFPPFDWEKKGELWRTTLRILCDRQTEGGAKHPTSLRKRKRKTPYPNLLTYVMELRSKKEKKWGDKPKKNKETRSENKFRRKKESYA